MSTIAIDHEKCTECRMCLIACEEIGINAVYLELEPRHRHEIDVHKCTYPTCVVCLMYCPAPGSIIEVETGRSLVPPPPELWRDREKKWLRDSLTFKPRRPAQS